MHRLIANFSVVAYFGRFQKAKCTVVLFAIALFLCQCTFSELKPPTQTSQSDSAQTGEKNSQSSDPNFKIVSESISHPLSPEKTEELLDEVGYNWLYGQGMGETMATVGTIVVFPPYALWVLGNAALELSGEQPVEVAKMLPDDSGKVWGKTYEEITSVPGRTSAAIAGEKYRSAEIASERIAAVLEENKAKKPQQQKMGLLSFK